MTVSLRALLGATAALALTGAAMAETTITVATVNNGDMIRMQGLMDDFYAKNPDIKVEWVTLEENVLRQNVTTDIATGGGQYDVLTIGTYEVPIWGKQGWLVSLNDLPAEYDIDDLLPAIRGGLTVDGNLFAAPFYGESSMVMYRKDLMEAAGLTMPEAPTWADIEKAAAAMTDKSKEQYGICLRGKAGWGDGLRKSQAGSRRTRSHEGDAPPLHPRRRAGPFDRASLRTLLLCGQRRNLGATPRGARGRRRLRQPPAQRRRPRRRSACGDDAPGS